MKEITVQELKEKKEKSPFNNYCVFLLEIFSPPRNKQILSFESIEIGKYLIFYTPLSIFLKFYQSLHHDFL